MLTLRRVTQAARPLLQQVLRLGLIVSLWPAPVPWLHSHREESRPSLVFHLQEFHSGNSDEHEGWHIHFTYLWRLADDPCAPEDRDEPPPCQLPATPAIAASAVSIVAPASLASFDVIAPAATLRAQITGREAAPRRIWPGGFLHSFAVVIAPHQLLGVLLC
jgi:hypothetical protein